MSNRSVTTFMCSGKFRIRSSRGQAAFVKIFATRPGAARRRTRQAFEHERICLKVLSGLAVPENLVLSARDRALLKLPGSTAPLVLAMKFVEGRPLGHGSHDVRELIACWLFVVEQLAAFRRQGILYADIKCSNILARRRPLRVTIVDFDGATALLPRQRHVRLERYTLGMESPEATQSRLVTEASVVYELGVLLYHCLTGKDNRTLRSNSRALGPVARLLAKNGAPDLARLLQDCLSPDPARRPQNYEDALSRAHALALPDDIRRNWRLLRGGCRARLADLGFEDP